jgi:hypothetical protein
MHIKTITGSDALKDLLLQHNPLGEINVTAYKTLAEYKKAASQNGEITIIDLDNIEADMGKSNIIYLSSAENPASNHLKKPFHLNELFSKLAEIIASDSDITIGGWQFNYRQRTLSQGGKTIDLTEKEAEILSFLANAAPNSIDKKELLGEVWGYDETIDTHTLETHIYRLRKKIGDDEFIINDGMGYKIK